MITPSVLEERMALPKSRSFDPVLVGLCQGEIVVITFSALASGLTSAGDTPAVN